MLFYCCPSTLGSTAAWCFLSALFCSPGGWRPSPRQARAAPLAHAQDAYPWKQPRDTYLFVIPLVRKSLRPCLPAHSSACRGILACVRFWTSSPNRFDFTTHATHNMHGPHVAILQLMHTTYLSAALFIAIAPFSHRHQPLHHCPRA